MPSHKKRREETNVIHLTQASWNLYLRINADNGDGEAEDGHGDDKRVSLLCLVNEALN